MDHTNKEWHEKRLTGIGGSDWQHVLSMEPYGCARRLVYTKRGTEPDYEQVETGVMRRGHALEPIAVEEFIRLTDATVTLGSLEGRKLQSLPEWWIGNLDRDLYPLGPFFEADGMGVLEIKTKSPNVLRKVIAEGVPDYEVAQLQHYMTLTGRKWGVYFALDPLDFDRSHMAVFQTDRTLEAQMLMAGERFWKMVTDGPMPDRLEVDDARCANCAYRETCQGDRLDAIAAADYGDYQSCVHPSLPQLVAEHEELKRLRDDVENMIKAKKEDIRELTGPGKWTDLCGYRISIAQRVQERINVKRLRAELPAIADDYTEKATPYWDVRTFGKRKS